MTPRGLDHLIHLVRDLDAAGAAYERLGFQVGPENLHPFGTKNRIVQFPGVFIEILAVGDHAPIPEHGPKAFSFAAFHRDRLERTGEGGSAIVLRSQNAKADAMSFANAKVGEFEPFFFERHGVRADGSKTHVAFELAFAADPAIPDLAFFTCEHKHPENFWNPAVQNHPNGTSGVAAAVLTAENPSDHHVFLKEFSGVRDFMALSSGMSLPLSNAGVDVLFGDFFAQRYRVSHRGDGSPKLSAIRLATPDLDRTAAAVAKAGGRLEARGERLIAPAGEFFGLTLSFERAPD